MRIPRSQSMTLGFPFAIIYSGRHQPFFYRGRDPCFRSIGFVVFPSCFSRSKFCILRAPTCITSTHISNICILSVDIISVTIEVPKSRARAGAGVSRPRAAPGTSRARCGLVCSAAKRAGSGGFNLLRYRRYLLRSLDAARPGDDSYLFPAYVHPAERYFGILRGWYFLFAIL